MTSRWRWTRIPPWPTSAPPIRTVSGGCPRSGPTGARDARAGDEPPSLLVLRALGLGDFVTAVPALRALERASDGWRRLLAGPPWYHPLAELAGLRWEVLPAEPLRTPKWRTATDPGTGPRLAVNLHGRGPRSTAALAALSPRELWTYSHPNAQRWPGPKWPDHVHDAEIWCGLLRHHGVDADPDDLRWPRPKEWDARPESAVVHPGASATSRRWPVERFAAVARHLSRSGLRVLVTGSAAERGRAEAVSDGAGLGPGSVLAGRTPVDLLARLVAEAAVVVSGDTGVAHLATAYATPSVRLFGPVPPELWGPRVDRDIHVCLWTGRRGDPHAAVLDPGLAAITVDEVLDACRTALQASPGRRFRPVGHEERI